MFGKVRERELKSVEFAAESSRLLAAMQGRSHGYSAGVSLVALLRREPGPLIVRHKPSGLAPDQRV